MMPLKNGKAPAGQAGDSPSDLLVGGIETNCNADLAEVSESAWATLIGLMLNGLNVETTVDLLDQLWSEPIDPVIAFWLAGIRLNAQSLTISTPTTAAHAALTAGLTAPPALRGQVASAGWKLASEVSGVPFACAPDFASIIREGHVRRTAERHVTAMSDALWRGDLSEVGQVVQRETDSLAALLHLAADHD